MAIRYSDTVPRPGDSNNVLLGKILQVLGTLPAPNDSENTLLQALLNTLRDASGNQDVPSGVKVFRAILNQSGAEPAEAPQVTVLQNTLGVVPQSIYHDPGLYSLYAVGAFPVGKTHILISTPTSDTTGIGSGAVYSANVWTPDNDYARIRVVNAATAEEVDYAFTNVFIQILVYP